MALEFTHRGQEIFFFLTLGFWFAQVLKCFTSQHSWHLFRRETEHHRIRNLWFSIRLELAGGSCLLCPFLIGYPIQSAPFMPQEASGLNSRRSPLLCSPPLLPSLLLLFPAPLVLLFCPSKLRALYLARLVLYHWTKSSGFVHFLRQLYSTCS